MPSCIAEAGELRHGHPSCTINHRLAGDVVVMIAPRL